MSNELIIDASTSEIAIALLEEKKLVELNKEKSNIQFSVGDIYLGKVKKIMPGLNAAFVDVGYEKDAFLHYLDLGPQFRSLNKYLNQALNRKTKIPILDKFRTDPDIDKHGKITNLMKAGQVILVQVAKEPIASKGPRLTSEISLAGRNLVLLPFSDKVSVSTKIKSEEERDRLKRLILSIKPKNYGVIVRTVAKERKVAVLDAELKSLVERWESIFQDIKSVEPPTLVLGELNRTSAILRDILNPSFNSISVNDQALYREIRDFIITIAPEKQKIVKYYSANTPIFEHFGIDKQIKTLFGKTVSYKSGAYLIIEHTEALHVIDVNSGNRSQSASDQETNALDVNLSAADEIARQLRLRDMGGIIVVDFIDMVKADNRQKVFDRMKEAMKADRAKHHILPVSKFGLIQITRQRVRPEMDVQIMESCSTCSGTGEVTPSILILDQVLNQFLYILDKYPKPKLTLKAHPYLAAYLRYGFPSIRMKWSYKNHNWLKIISDPNLGILNYEFLDQNGEKFVI
ncbi:MAG: Rne/Rng family ribonuclease [Porphyromonadaceae bacterium]|nr:MAG: Rne/Rng family ribonuclease [Porphyromonadaceae bacterium]